jgi:nucleobase:cation symporter-1, NCS1 family
VLTIFLGNLYGRYHYHGGFSLVAIASLILSVLPNLPGFLVTIKALPAATVAPLFVSLYHYAWFVGFFLAFFLYLLERKLAPND